MKMNQLLTLMLSMIVAVAFTTGCNIVEEGHVGVHSFMGKMRDNVQTPGAKFNFNKVTVVSTQNQNYSKSSSSDSPRAAVSADMQSVGFSIDMVWYVPDGESAKSLYQYVSNDPAKWRSILIEPVVDQAVKSVFYSRTLRELVNDREQVRMEVKGAIEELVDERLVGRHESLSGAIQIKQVALSNLDYSEEFEEVIEKTQREEQRSILAENELNRVRIESQQKVVQAEAEKEAAITQAEGEARSRVIRAQAEGESYKILSEAGLDIDLYRYTEIWDGHMPVVAGGQAPVMLPSALIGQ